MAEGYGVPIIWFFVGFFAVYFLVSAIRAILRGIAYALGWLWGYADARLQGRLLPSLGVLGVVSAAAWVLGG